METEMKQLMNNQQRKQLNFDAMKTFTKQTKYKTELCKTFQATGKCPYGRKCLFAHSLTELNSKHQNQNYKKKLCKNFHEFGYCPYGIRCSFIHNEKKSNNSIFHYYYLQLFIHKEFGVLSNQIFTTPLFNDRLPVFKNMSDNDNLNETIEIPDFNKKCIEHRTASISTNSNEDNELDYLNFYNVMIPGDNNIEDGNKSN